MTPRSNALPTALFAGAVFIMAVLSLAGADASDGPPAVEFPAWVKDVGTRRAPPEGKTFAVKTYGAVSDGKTVATVAIQQAIDACSAAGGGSVVFETGTYLTGALFLKSNVHMRVDEGVTLLGVQDETAYPKIWTRVAGIEMEWPAALINVNEQSNVKISGRGIVDGNGQLWWNKYWTMRRQDYEPRGLRWAADYDCERVRLMVVWKSSDVAIEGVKLRRSGFWTLQVCYADHVTVDGIKISDNTGPSTDGVDIDSSSYVLVQNCDIDNNDDCICLKSGRDADGLRIARPAEYVVVRGNTTRRGGGIVSFGSETSGGIRHVVVSDNTGIGTSEGIRFKSARTRGGYIEDVLVRDIKMENVPAPFTFTLNWNPQYSYVTLPKDTSNLPPNLKNAFPAHWAVMAAPVEPAERGFCTMRNITIANIEVKGARRGIISASGLPGKLLTSVHWENVVAQGQQAGSVDYASNWTMKNVKFVTSGGEALRVTNSERVAAPEVVRAQAADAKQ